MSDHLMSVEEFLAIEERERAATRGPWDIVNRGTSVDWDVVANPVRDTEFLGCYRGMFCRKEDAEFIAHARTDIPALLAEVRRLRALLGERERLATGHG